MGKTMETAERICKRFHSYLISGEYTGRVGAITGINNEYENLIIPNLLSLVSDLYICYYIV